MITDAPSPEAYGQHNYAGPLLAMMQAGVLDAPPGTVRHIDIYHDTWCAIYKGGYCNCEPIIAPRGDPALN